MVKGLLLTMAMIVFGLLTVTAFVLTLVKRQNKKHRTIWLIVFSISIILTISTSLYIAKKVINKSIEKSTEAKDAFINGVFEGFTDNRDYLLDTVNKNRQIELLKSYVPDSLQNKVPSSFYTDFGFRDSYRLPIVYPYSINCVDILENGQISDERNAIDITRNDDGVNQLQVYGITEFSFDKNLLVAKLSDEFEPTKDRGYILFHFDNQKTEEFKTKSELMKRARQLGFSGEDKMMTLKEYNQLFLKKTCADKQNR